MKKRLFFALLPLFVWASCVQDAPFSSAKNDANAPKLSVLKEDNPEWHHENLRLFPVVASAEVMESNARLNQLKTLAEAMQQPGFRIMEQKQFGRTDGEWYHGLTVQNKTQDTVLLLSGDVVKGGNQDRVIAHHEVIMPMTVRNIEVFCVEAGRSTYYDPAAPPAEKEAAAFKGYYNVASPQVRRAVQQTGNQQEVWNAVAKVTEANQAQSSTKAYTALDNESAQKAQRDAYLKQLEGKLTARKDVVGMIAVCGDKVLGIDIFGTPGLFQRQYSALLHGYVAEAAVSQVSQNTIDDKQLEAAFQQVSFMMAPHAKANEQAGKFSWGGAWVHLFSN